MATKKRSNMQFMSDFDKKVAKIVVAVIVVLGAVMLVVIDRHNILDRMYMNDVQANSQIIELRQHVDMLTFCHENAIDQCDRASINEWNISHSDNQFTLMSDEEITNKAIYGIFK